MANDASLYVRQAGLSRLKAAPGVTALVPASRIWPAQRPANPTWPFVSWGVPTTTPFLAQCMDGSTIDVAVHVYAHTTDAAGGEDSANAIAQAVVAALHGSFAIDGESDCPVPATAHFEWQRTQVIQDGPDADAFHAIVQFSISVSS